MEKKLLSRIYIGLAVFFTLCLLAGSFYDLQLARTLYIDSFAAAKGINFITFCIYFGSCMFFLGALFRQLINHLQKTYMKVLLTAAFIYLYLSTAALGGGEILNDPVFQSIIIGIEVNLINCLMAGTVLFAPLFIAGIIANGSKHDKETIKSITKLVLIMTMVFFISTYFNTMIIRPHYRLTLTDPAMSFSPWYKLSNTGGVLLSLSDLISSHPGSFICGHAAYAIVFTIIFPSCALVINPLKGKEKLLTITALLIIIPIVISRMLTGDNYLSDIALGAISAIKVCFSFNALTDKSRKGIIIRFLDVITQKK